MQTLIPRPQSITIDETKKFILSSRAKINFSGPVGDDVAKLLAEYLGLQLSSNTSEITLKTNSIAKLDDAGFADESYIMEITASGILIDAKTDYGLARGIQTLRQLLPPQTLSSGITENDELAIPCLRIKDHPRFRWRGLHLDISRHFFNADQICDFIDLMALHKLNILHLHLTDDQGWRVEISKYPKLTTTGAQRAESLIGHETDRPRRYDGIPHGGFLSKTDVEHIVNYATARRMNVLPEIDLPGHMQAAISAYPEFGNMPIQLKPRCHWGISQHILNPKMETVEFMKDVLSEVMAMFPSRFIHIGGDEALKHEWSESREAQQIMADLNLRDENQLQSWFISQLGTHITNNGRRMIGWDEILEGGLPNGATVMSWRGEKGAIEALKLGHDAVMAPNTHTYFDHYQDEPTQEEPLAFGCMLPIGKVYEFEPVPDQTGSDQSEKILGAQGQLWTEYISDYRHLQYMAFPRACALAETLWLEKETKNYQKFLEALLFHRKRLAAKGCNYHPRP